MGPADMTSFGPDDADLHDAKGKHLRASRGTTWNRRLEAHVELHVRAALAHKPAGSPWEQGAHIPRQLRTLIADP